MIVEHCAACGNESETLKMCRGCNNAKYCNADCQKLHRKHHQADCKKKAAEFEVALFEIGKRAAELFDDILFKKPSLMEDCPICMLPLPFRSEGVSNVYQPCCGKILCDGYVIGMAQRDSCLFCRERLFKNEEESIRMYTKRMALGDASAFVKMGTLYDDGDKGLKQDKKKALEMY